MPRPLRLMFALLLLAALGACDQKPSREERIVASLPLQDAYDHNIGRMTELLAMTHPKVPPARIKTVLQKHLTVEDQRNDLFKLYSEENFSDQEFDTIVAATQDPEKAKALGASEEGQRLSEKLTRLMRATAQDEQVQALAQQRMQQVEDELAQIAKATDKDAVAP